MYIDENIKNKLNNHPSYKVYLFTKQCTEHFINESLNQIKLENSLILYSGNNKKIKKKIEELCENYELEYLFKTQEMARNYHETDLFNEITKAKVASNINLL